MKDHKMTDDKKIGLKTFGLTNLAVNNKVTVYLITGIILLFGLVAYTTIPKESFPEVSFPQLFINTPYFGNSAKDIESLVTRPIEKEIATITGLKKVSSQSMQDFSIITAEFDSDMALDLATRKVKDAIDRAKPELPSDLTSDPEVIEINLAELPIMTVNLSGEYSNEQLKSLADRLQDDLEDIKEISAVNIKGVQDKEVKIDVDLMKMQAREVSFGDIENAIRSENVTLSGGEIVKNEFRTSLRVVGQFSNVREIEDIIVKSENQNSIYLRDIADVKLDFEDQTSIARANSLPVVSLDIIKRKGENLLSASDKIKEIVKEAEIKYLPKGTEVTIFNDQSTQTRDSVNNLENSIISGVILVVLVLLFFLGLRNSTFVGVAIPLSMLMGFLLISALGYTLNMVVLFGLILALGMLVDNGIVVVENIYRYMQDGFSADDAAKYGTGEVALPIIASTATTLAAFIPLAFWPGLMGGFMKYLPITLIMVLSSSLFVALVINPVLCAKFMKVDEKMTDKKLVMRKRNFIFTLAGTFFVIAIVGLITNTVWVRNLFGFAGVLTFVNYFLLRPASLAFQNAVVPWMENVYNKFIRFALKGIMPYLIFFGTFISLFLVMGLLSLFPPKVDLFPKTEPLYVNAFIELPIGKDITATNEISREIETRVNEAIKPYDGIVEAVLTQIGENTADPNGGPAFGAQPQSARLTVTFVPSDQRGDLSSISAMDDIRAALKGIPGVQIVVDQNATGPPQAKPIYIEVSGDDVNTLVGLSEQMIAFLNRADVEGVEELKADVKLGKPEIEVNIDRAAARRFELSTYGISDALRTSIFGKEVSKLKVGEDDYPIFVRAAPKYRNNVENVMNQKITFRNPANGRIAQIPINAVADIDYKSTYTSINRNDQERIITITSNVLAGFNPNEVVGLLKEELEDFDMPDGYSYAFTGQQEEMEEQIAFLSKALLIALFSIFLIIVAQFNSILSPIIILLSVLFSLIGVLLGYIATGMDFIIVMSGVGIISLAGIVVNNAIVLIDYTNLVVQRKREAKGFSHMNKLSKEDIKEAIVAGGSTRLRPVLLTAITTVLGLIPLAIGLNINFFTLITDSDPQFFIGGDNAVFWGTMAKTVIYGLIFATFLTLIVVPVMYWLFYRAQHSFSNLFSRSTNDKLVFKDAPGDLSIVDDE